MEPVLSILTPALPSRWGPLQQLCAKLAGQIGSGPVEHLVLLDNKRRTVGEKRDALLRAARGQYVAYVDDDDDVTDRYVPALLQAAASGPDVITFEQRVTYNGQTGVVHFGLGNPNEPFQPGRITKRNAWHSCAWRRQLAILSCFPAVNYGEDWAFASLLCQLAGLRAAHIPEILHHYQHDSRTTEAPPP